MNGTAIGIYAATGALGVWELVTGRGMRSRPRGRLGGRALRIVGAATMLGCLVAIGLVLVGNQGFAFLTFAITAVVTAAVTIELPPTHEAT